MNDRASEQVPHDQSIEQLLSRLKQLEPPLRSRIANRTVIATEMARSSERHRNRALPFWRRTISVPLPIAVGAVAAVALLVSLSLITLRPNRPFQREPSVSTVDGELGKGVGQGMEDALIPVTKSPTLAYYEGGVYLCGIGQLRSEARYVIEE